VYYFHTAHVIYSEMKNPFSIILVIAAIALFVSGQTGFFIPMIMFIVTHDAFEYIRIQDDFAAFEENGYRLTAKMDIPQGGDGDAEVDPLLLERLQKLSELRDRGILTEQEFLVQKEKLLG